MKKYHIYGMGNALVDMEFKVGEEQLQRLNIDKGHMTLIELRRKQEILKALGKTEIQACSCGGSAANTMIAASQLGAKTFYSCKVADDREGLFYLDDLQEHGVDSLGRGSEGGVTGKCLVMVTPDSQRSMSTYLGISSHYSPEEVAKEALANSQYLYIEGYLLASPISKQAVSLSRKIARKHGAKIALTFSDVNMINSCYGEMLEVVEDGVDILFGNEEEVLAFAQRSDLQGAIDEIGPLAKIMAITRGPGGAWIWNGKQLIEIPGKLVQAVDSSGAGDMFSGAFLSVIAQGGTPHSLGELGWAGQLACHCASRLVERWGPRLSSEEVREAAAQAEAEGPSHRVLPD